MKPPPGDNVSFPPGFQLATIQKHIFFSPQPTLNFLDDWHVMLSFLRGSEQSWAGDCYALSVIAQ